MAQKPLSDRRLPRRSVILAAPMALAAAATPSQSEGPFYPLQLPADRDFDLTAFGDRRAQGEVIEMAGQVRDLAGRPVPDAVVEIWHCDPAGIYPHVGRNNGGLADPDFQGFGAVAVGPDGGYRFRTIRPGLYPGRVRHIHVKVRRPQGVLTTQMYFPEEENGGDFLFRRGGQALVAARIDGPPPRYVFDIALEG